MRNALAWCVAHLSWSIVSRANPAARASALVRCLEVSDAGSRDVYCLTVPATSSFCIATGLVVHNTRYGLMSGLDIACVKPVEVTHNVTFASDFA